MLTGLFFKGCKSGPAVMPLVKLSPSTPARINLPRPANYFVQISNNDKVVKAGFTIKAFTAGQGCKIFFKIKYH